MIFDLRFEESLLPAQSKIKNRKSLLPTGFDDAGNLPLERQFAKTDAAQIKFTQVATGATTALTARVSTDGKLRFAVRFRNQ